MANAWNTTRRGLLKRLPTAAVIATLPAACTPEVLGVGVATAEDISNRIHDLAWEIADLLKAQGQERYVVIHSSNSPTAVFVGKIIREA